MNHALKLLLTVVATAVFLVGCSSNDVQQRHADLQAFTPSIKAKVVWKTRVGLGSEEHFTALQPAYSDGVVYAAERYGLLIAHDAKTGKRLWQQDFGGKKRFFEHFPRGESARLSAGPVIVNDRIYLSSENGVVYALNKSNGETLWQTQVKGEVMSPVAVGEGYVVVHLSNGYLVALRETDGVEQWSFEEDTSLLSLRSVSRPAITSGGVVVGTSTGKLQVLLLDSGRLAWEERIVIPTGSSDLERMTDVDGSPLIVGDTVYVSGYNGQTVALELRNGEVLWKREYASASAPSLIRNRLFLISQESHVVALDRISGTELWRNNDLHYRSLTDVTLHGDYLAVGDRFGYMHWLNRLTGELVGRIKLDEGDAIRTAPVQVEENLVVQSAAGRLYLIKQLEAN
ncbi:outer membrane protein assembly factor BamB [Aliidiomarina quisquiliarum]|uniref:outer membrane protein assembly factor BamB n=1 Tax=Aliidiomarina quisquiliarum TaxID=2938947 RepID=UPI00208FF48D|nr:outer membrane protein assembly factor BamB [Aliidiomarina quisquiliarum]MCO4321569.1 outer membrane protein assembly factor BamB [Aliidiomarina quisquiliarum]